GHALAARGLVRERSRRTLSLGSMHFPHPHADAFAHAARAGLEPAIGPIRFKQRVLEFGFAVEFVEIGADDLAILHADAGVVDEIRHAAGGVDLIVRAAPSTGFRLDDLDAVFQAFLRYYNPRQSGIGRAGCDIELHRRGSFVRTQSSLLTKSRCGSR